MPQLDALRAAAVLAVMAHHFLPIHQYIPNDYVNIGVFAVRMFFVLSGFLITGILLRARSEEPKSALKQFYIRRVLRIFPIYYIALFVALAFNLESIWARAWWHLTYLTNFVYPFQPELTWPASHFWTLAVEEQFYLVWPFILIFLPAKYLFKAIVGIIALAVVFRAVVLYAFNVPEVAAVWTFGAMDSLGLGALLAIFRHDEALRPHLKKFLRFCLFAGLALLVLLTLMLVFNRGYRVVYIGRYLCLSLLFVVLIDRASRGFTGKLKSVMEWPPVLYIGRVSYGLYVYHLFVFAAVVSFCLARWGATPHYLIVAFVSTVLTFAAAIVSWHLIERPISELKHRFGSGRPATPAPAPAAGELTVNTDVA